MLSKPVRLSVEQVASMEARIVGLERALANYASRHGMTEEARHLLVEARPPLAHGDDAAVER